LKFIKILLILLFIAFVIFNLISATDEKQETQNFAGKIKDVKGSLYLISEGEFYELELGSDKYLEEINLNLVNKDKISVNGIMEEEVITVHNLTKNDTLFSFIDAKGKSLWNAETDKKFYIVNGKKCIGCTLCVTNCPVGAIEMVKGVAIIDPVKCATIACGICKNGNTKKYKGCPVDAIAPNK
jgi:ferredoxin